MTHSTADSEGRVTEADNLRHGLQQMTEHAERLAKDCRDKDERIRELEELVAALRKS